MAKKGLYYNINQKRKRIAAGSGEKMRKAGDKGAPSKQDFIDSAKTAKAFKGGFVARGCGVINPNRKKKTMIA